MYSSVVASVRNLSSNFLFVLELCFKLMGLLAYFSHCLTTNTGGVGGNRNRFRRKSKIEQAFRRSKCLPTK